MTEGTSTALAVTGWPICKTKNRFRNRKQHMKQRNRRIPRRFISL